MKVRNIHERTVPAAADQAGEILDSLAGNRDRIWPRRRWPAMRLDASLAEHGRGGHGPIRYRVSDYRPGHRVAFRFEDEGLSRGLDGDHYFELEERTPGEITARHVIEARLRGRALLLWPLFIRPLHDALLEDALDNFERATTGAVRRPHRYSPYVRLLRKLVLR